MESKLKSVDCIVEVHDARIPVSGRNPRLAASFLAAKPYILVLNKADLIPAQYQPVIRSTLLEREQIKNVIFTNCKNDSCPGLKAVSLDSILYIICIYVIFPNTRLLKRLWNLSHLRHDTTARMRKTIV